MARDLRVAAAAAGFALAAALPALVVVAFFAAAGWVAPGPALGAGFVILVAGVLIVGGRAAAAARARAAVAALTGTGAPPAADLAETVERLGRQWRLSLDDAEARRQAAEAVVAALPDPLILIDERRRIRYANIAATAVVGAAAEPRDLASALRNPAVLAATDAVLAGAAAEVVEFAVTAPVERQWRARVARIDGPSLEGAAAVLTLHDITALKRAEAMRADFIANASHELRTPLATLIGFIETLRGAARDDAEARDRFLAIMHEQASRMARLVADLLSLSQIELNEHVPPQDRVELPSLLRQVAAALELRAEQRRMRIVLSLPAGLPAVQGDADELAQVFQNLLDNAIKYGREGTEIRVAAQPSRPQAGQGEFVAVSVADQGEGIAREHLARLTERFYRVDNARSRALGGTGLGLAIVKHILNRHRGFLDIESAPGRGSAFTVNLPPAPAPAEAAASAAPD
jgi:two-component system, OmpR family, phosphate regulon sensor histidine kinase PhoR